MPQSLTQMPQRADFVIDGQTIEIRDHKVKSSSGLFGIMIRIMEGDESDRQSLCQFEKHGISFETAIECCAHDIENDVYVLGNIIFWNYDIKETKESGTFEHLNAVLAFSESTAGRTIAEQFIEKIRSCDDWEELCDEMHPTSKFYKDIKNRILKELKKQNRIKKEMIK